MPCLTNLVVLTMYNKTVLGQKCSAEAFNEITNESYLNKKLKVLQHSSKVYNTWI